MRIAITNNNPLAIDALKKIVLSVPEHELAWIAEDGAQAINMAKMDVPDLILLDIGMPTMDGVETTKIIMQQSPCAILIMTSSIKKNSGKVFDAMGYGAMDVVNVPSFETTAETPGTDDLLRKIASMNLLIRSSNQNNVKSNRNKSLSVKKQSNEKILVIGASTGGPKALATILAGFPHDFAVPIVVVQHVDQEFAEGLKEWLNNQVVLSVTLAKHCELLTAGTVYLAGMGKHLTINKSCLLDYQDEPANYPHKPSVNVLFESIVSNWKGQAIGVLLTGMGKDGATGLLSMRDHGFCTLAQDEESCAVYGMPKTAIQMGAAQVVLPLDQIAPAICKHYDVNTMSQEIINE